MAGGRVDSIKGFFCLFLHLQYIQQKRYTFTWTPPRLVESEARKKSAAHFTEFGWNYAMPSCDHRVNCDRGAAAA